MQIVQGQFYLSKCLILENTGTLLRKSISFPLLYLKYIADTFLSVVPVDFSGGDLQWKGCLGSYLSIICVLALYILKVNNSDISHSIITLRKKKTYPHFCNTSTNAIHHADLFCSLFWVTEIISRKVEQFDRKTYYSALTWSVPWKQIWLFVLKKKIFIRHENHIA